MIFVTLGTQKFQFNRLLRIIDELVDEKYIVEPVFAQIGESSYTPRNYEYSTTLDSELFNSKINQANLIITHSGVGTILKGIKSGKKVIVFPRLAEYDEHVDDHQVEIANAFSELKYVMSCNSKENLINVLSNVDKFNPENYRENNDIFIKNIKKIIIDLFNKK